MLKAHQKRRWTNSFPPTLHSKLVPSTLLFIFLLIPTRGGTGLGPSPTRARPETFFELFGVFEPEVLGSGPGPTWPELERKARGYPRVPAGTRNPYFTKSIFVTSNIPDLFLEGLFNLLDLLYSKMTLRLCTLHTWQSTKLKTNYCKVKSQSSHQN